jgi:hypothetical protein
VLITLQLGLRQVQLQLITHLQGYFYNNQSGLISAEDIRRGKRKCLISALSISIAPDEEDIIIGNEDNVAITHVMTIYNAGTAVCYICETAE